MSASDHQHGGDHYHALPTEAQPWNVLKHWLTPEEYRGWQKGVAITYLARERGKGGDLDIRKAAHHLERLMEEFAAAEAVPAVEPAWIEWSGGECPIPRGVVYNVRFRNGHESNTPNKNAPAMTWAHTGGPGDIIAYRVVPQ